MEKKIELSLDQMEEVTGGVNRTVNTGVADLKAAVRKEASKGSKQIASLSNGTIVDTVSDTLVFDPVSKRNFVEVTFYDQSGTARRGWVAASILGMPR